MTKYIFVALIVLTSFFGFSHEVEATAYYISFDSASTTNCASTNNGLATTSSFCSLDQFTEVARTAGDIAFVRRGYATTTGVTDLNFTSDGTIANPIIISADYDNNWGDFASSSQTYTIAVATSTFTASAAQSQIIVGEWVYVEGDCSEVPPNTLATALNQCEFAYEVASVASTSIGLYLPYKGNQTGAGKNLRILSSTTLGSNPQWNVASGDFQWNFDTDNHWLVKGMDIRGTDLNGQVELDSSDHHIFFDTIFTGNGASDVGFGLTDDFSYFVLNKCRVFNDDFGINDSTLDHWSRITIIDSIFDGNSIATSAGILGGNSSQSSNNVSISDSVFRNYTSGDLDRFGLGIIYGRNVSLKSAIEISSASDYSSFYFEDYDGLMGDNRQNLVGAGTNINISLLLSTSTLRSGGGPTAIEVRPTTNTTSIWDFNKIKLFDYPIYTNTTSKQYDVYFRNATSTTQFTTDPLATELWIECEYWAHDTNATSTRKIKKSTGVLDFNGNANWQNLSVTCQPTQTGIMYLRAYYAKTKESGGSNIFLIDNTPVIQ